jgi:alpha-tubulin suppressor-like RCC1 family protein
LYAWGSNSFGQLGIRNRANRDGHRFHQVRTQFTRCTSTKLQLLHTWTVCLQPHSVYSLY